MATRPSRPTPSSTGRTYGSRSLGVPSPTIPSRSVSYVPTKQVGSLGQSLSPRNARSQLASGTTTVYEPPKKLPANITSNVSPGSSPRQPPKQIISGVHEQVTSTRSCYPTQGQNNLPGTTSLLHSRRRDPQSRRPSMSNLSQPDSINVLDSHSGEYESIQDNVDLNGASPVETSLPDSDIDYVMGLSSPKGTPISSQHTSPTLNNMTITTSCNSSDVRNNHLAKAEVDLVVSTSGGGLISSRSRKTLNRSDNTPVYPQSTPTVLADAGTESTSSRVNRQSTRSSTRSLVSSRRRTARVDKEGGRDDGWDKDGGNDTTDSQSIRRSTRSSGGRDGLRGDQLVPSTSTESLPSSVSTSSIISTLTRSSMSSLTPSASFDQDIHRSYFTSITTTTTSVGTTDSTIESVSDQPNVGNYAGNSDDPSPNQDASTELSSINLRLAGLLHQHTSLEQASGVTSMGGSSSSDSSVGVTPNTNRGSSRHTTRRGDMSSYSQKALQSQVYKDTLSSRELSSLSGLPLSALQHPPSHHSNSNHQQQPQLHQQHAKTAFGMSLNAPGPGAVIDPHALKLQKELAERQLRESLHPSSSAGTARGEGRGQLTSRLGAGRFHGGGRGEDSVTSGGDDDLCNNGTTSESGGVTKMLGSWKSRRGDGTGSIGRTHTKRKQHQEGGGREEKSSSGRDHGVSDNSNQSMTTSLDINNNRREVGDESGFGRNSVKTLVTAKTFNHVLCSVGLGDNYGIDGFMIVPHSPSNHHEPPTSNLANSLSILQTHQNGNNGSNNNNDTVRQSTVPQLNHDYTRRVWLEWSTTSSATTSTLNPPPHHLPPSDLYLSCSTGDFARVVSIFSSDLLGVAPLYESITQISSTGWSPLTVAIRGGHVAVVAFLLLPSLMLKAELLRQIIGWLSRYPSPPPSAANDGLAAPTCSCGELNRYLYSSLSSSHVSSLNESLRILESATDSTTANSLDLCAALCRPTAFGLLPIHIAVITNDSVVCRMLLSFGSDPTARTLPPQTRSQIGHMCNTNNNTYQHDASTKPATWQGDTPLIIAARTGSTKVMCLLLRINSLPNTTSPLPVVDVSPHTLPHPHCSSQLSPRLPSPGPLSSLAKRTATRQDAVFVISSPPQSNHLHINSNSKSNSPNPPVNPSYLTSPIPSSHVVSNPSPYDQYHTLCSCPRIPILDLLLSCCYEADALNRIQRVYPQSADKLACTSSQEVDGVTVVAWSHIPSSDNASTGPITMGHQSTPSHTSQVSLLLGPPVARPGRCPVPLNTRGRGFRTALHWAVCNATALSTRLPSQLMPDSQADNSVSDNASEDRTGYVKGNNATHRQGSSTQDPSDYRLVKTWEAVILLVEGPDHPPEGYEWLDLDAVDLNGHDARSLAYHIAMNPRDRVTSTNYTNNNHNVATSVSTPSSLPSSNITMDGTYAYDVALQEGLRRRQEKEKARWQSQQQKQHELRQIKPIALPPLPSSSSGSQIPSSICHSSPIARSLSRSEAVIEIATRSPSPYLHHPTATRNFSQSQNIYSQLPPRLRSTPSPHPPHQSHSPSPSLSLISPSSTRQTPVPLPPFPASPMLELSRTQSKSPHSHVDKHLDTREPNAFQPTSSLPLAPSISSVPSSSSSARPHLNSHPNSNLGASNLSKDEVSQPRDKLKEEGVGTRRMEANGTFDSKEKRHRTRRKRSSRKTKDRGRWEDTDDDSSSPSCDSLSISFSSSDTDVDVSTNKDGDTYEVYDKLDIRRNISNLLPRNRGSLLRKGKRKGRGKGKGLVSNHDAKRSDRRDKCLQILHSPSQKGHEAKDNVDNVIHEGRTVEHGSANAFANLPLPRAGYRYMGTQMMPPSPNASTQTVRDYVKMLASSRPHHGVPAMLGNQQSQNPISGDAPGLPVTSFSSSSPTSSSLSTAIYSPAPPVQTVAAFASSSSPSSSSSSSSPSSTSSLASYSVPVAYPTLAARPNPFVSRSIAQQTESSLLPSIKTYSSTKSSQPSPILPTTTMLRLPSLLPSFSAPIGGSIRPSDSIPVLSHNLSSPNPISSSSTPSTSSTPSYPLPARSVIDDETHARNVITLARSGFIQPPPAKYYHHQDLGILMVDPLLSAPVNLRRNQP